MNFNKPMIDLVRELRKRAPAEEKPGIKLANPDLMQEMIPWFHCTKDVVVKALIKELFEYAGEDWPDKLAAVEKLGSASEKTAPAADGKRYVTRVYRGQTQLVEVTSEDKTSRTPRTQRVYRGQVVRI